MAAELVRSAMEKRVGDWACEIGDGEKVWRKKVGVSIRVSVSGSCCVKVGVFD